MDRRIHKTISFLGAVALVAVAVGLINHYGIAQLRASVEQMGLWAPFGLFVLRFTSVVIPALPGTAYSILAGSLLGFGEGLVMVCLSDFLSCTLSFWLSRQFGRQLVKKLVGERFIGRVDRFSQRHLERNFFLMTACLMTGFFDFVAYGIGLARSPWQKFLPALVLSIALSNPPIVALGAGLFAQGKLLLVFALLGAFGLALIAELVQRWMRQANVK